MTRISNVRKTTKFKRSIRAISPVIATLLMIAIAVVASLVAYAWVMGYMGGTTTKAGKAIQLPSFAVDNSNDLHVYVQNVGQGSVELSTVYVNDALKPFTVTNLPDNVLGEGKTAELVVTAADLAGVDLTKTLNIKVTTTDGTFMQTTGSATSGSTQTQASINLNPLLGLAGSGVSVSGSGFATNALLSATFDGVAVTLGGMTSTDGSGAFSGATFTVPAGASAGGKAVVFTDGTILRSGTFTVTPAGMPAIVLNPSSGLAGSGVSVSGSGFATNALLSATFDGVAVTLGGMTSTDGSGAFSGATFTVPAGASAGGKAVVFHAGATSGSQTFTVNTAGTTGTIHVFENSVPDDAAQTFTFWGNDDINGYFQITDATGGGAGTEFISPLTVAPGDYTIIQTAATGWTLTDITGATTKL